jgi:hypothetical protein
MGLQGLAGPQGPQEPVGGEYLFRGAPPSPGNIGGYAGAKSICQTACGATVTSSGPGGDTASPSRPESACSDVQGNGDGRIRRAGPDSRSSPYCRYLACLLRRIALTDDCRQAPIPGRSPRRNEACGFVADVSRCSHPP